MRNLITNSWATILKDEFDLPYFRNLQSFLEQDRIENIVYPAESEVFTALNLTPYEKVKVVILGQDPYHQEFQAHGLAFSVKKGVNPPMSLTNIYKELNSDLGIAKPSHGCLISWAEQGVLLLNTILTVRKNKPNSHKEQGWEIFTNAIIQSVSEKKTPVIFVLWGKQAQLKVELIDDHHHILRASHPSPMSARKGFFGSKPFSKINELLTKLGEQEIDWRID